MKDYTETAKRIAQAELAFGFLVVAIAPVSPMMPDNLAMVDR